MKLLVLTKLYDKLLSLFKPELIDIYLIEVIYKSGKAKMFWCTSFTGDEQYYRFERHYTEAYPDKGDIYPFIIGNKEMASIWQVGTMKVKVN